MSELESDVTPIDRPLMRSDLNDVRTAMHDVSQKTLQLYTELKGVRGQFRVYVALCVASAFVCLVSAVVSVVARAAP